MANRMKDRPPVDVCCADANLTRVRVIKINKSEDRGLS